MVTNMVMVSLFFAGFFCHFCLNMPYDVVSCLYNLDGKLHDVNSLQSSLMSRCLCAIYVETSVKSSYSSEFCFRKLRKLALEIGIYSLDRLVDWLIHFAIVQPSHSSFVLKEKSISVS